MEDHHRHPLLVRDDATLLIEAARAAADRVDLRGLVERFAELTLDASDAWRATVFLADGDSLVLWANQSRETRVDTRQRNWERGLELGSIDLREVPARQALFDMGLPVAIPDARSSELVPESWVESFGLGALVVAPLVAGGEPLGLLVTDWPDRHDIPDGVVEMIGAIAGTLSLAVQNALLTSREAQRADALQSLLEATTVLRSSEGLEDLAERLVQPLARALGATGISICLFDDGGPRYRTLADWNPAIDKRGSLRDIARPLQQRIAGAWRQRPEPLVLSAEEMEGLTPRRREGPIVVLPLAGADLELLGFVLVTLHEHQPPAPAVELAGALASHLAAAVERAQLQESLALETERLRGLCALWGFEADALEAYSAAIEEAIGPALGFTVVRVSVTDADLRSLGYFAEPDELDHQLLARWQRRRRAAHEALPACDPRELAAPLTVRGRIVGVVRARARHAHLSQREAEMLDALAAAFGRAIEQENGRRESRERELGLALAEERERVAARLHDTVGRLLYALNLRAGTLRLAAAEGLFAEEARQIEALARSGLSGLRRAVATLASMRLDDQGLVPSLERLVADFQDAHGTAIRLAVDGSDKTLPSQVEEALYRVAHEALANVERHAKASHVTVSLDLRGEEAVLRVVDDGLGLGRSESPQGTGLGLELARKALEPVSGCLDLTDTTPGVAVVARVPLSVASIEVTP